MSKYTPKELNLMYRVISTALKTVEDEVLGLITIGIIYSYNIINRLCYCSKKFPRRESHSLEPEGTGFTDPPAYFNGLLRIIYNLLWLSRLLHSWFIQLNLGIFNSYFELSATI